MSYIQKYFKPLHAVPGLIGGILIYHIPITGFITTICLITTLCLFPVKQTIKTRFHTSALCIAWCLTGWSVAWYEMRPFNILYEYQYSPLALTGTITDYNYCSHIRYPHRITIAIDTITHNDTTDYPEGSLHIYTNHHGISQPYSIGSLIAVDTITIKKPNESFARYLIKEGLLASIFVSHTKIQCIRQKAEATLASWLSNKRATMFNQITAKLSDSQSALFSALFLGNKIHTKEQVDIIQTKFRFWGVAHIFARSGMHISMIIGIILYLLFLIPIPYSFKIICSTLIGILYALLSWSTISFTRALTMFLWSNYCILARRYTSTLHLLGITTILVLLWHPLNLFFLDFQLSFALTGALVWICSYLAYAV